MLVARSLLLLWLSAGCTTADPEPAPDALGGGKADGSGAEIVRCKVIVLGGTTAATAAALAAADAGDHVCLVEPTEWVGGQLTASGVSAIDWAWHRIGTLDVGAAAKARENVTTNLFAMAEAMGNPGGCWVSKNCFEPKRLLTGGLGAIVGRRVAAGRLVILKQAVPKRITRSGSTITSVTVVQRTAKEGVTWGGYDRLPSADLPDWYSSEESARYRKRTVELRGIGSDAPVVIDATEWGEGLVLADAAYAVGVEHDESTPVTDEACGQAIVFPFVERFTSGPETEPPVPAADERSAAFYSLGSPTLSAAARWDRIFRYRRIRGSGPTAHAGELTLQNWNPGNDYPFGYLLLPHAAASAQRADWRGGIDLDVLAGAERHAFGWHAFFKASARELGLDVVIDYTILGTGHGLSKLPYIRDTRRSIGLDGFVLASRDLIGEPDAMTGTAFSDRVAIGAYAVDIHGLAGCAYPAYVLEHHDTRPYFIPFRALTNRDVGNLLVAGKTLAQTFLANASTRVHPVEWATGTAAGVAASFMAARHLDTRGALAAVAELQARVRSYTPIAWTIDGRTYPAP